MVRKTSSLIVLIFGLVIIGAGCSIESKNSFGSPSSTLDIKETKNPEVKSTFYTNDKFGFLIDLPNEVMVADCSYHEAEGKKYVLPDQRAAAPLIHTEIAGGIVFYPQWYMEPSGEVALDKVLGEYYSTCQKKTAVGSSLTKRAVYMGDFPYWTVLSETVLSEEDIPKSILRHCSKFAKFTGLKTIAQAGVFDVSMDVDMTKTNDSSEVICNDLVYARFVPVNQKIYYLFKSGISYIDDMANEQIEKSLRFIVNNPV